MAIGPAAGAGWWDSRFCRTWTGLGETASVGRRKKSSFSAGVGYRLLLKPGRALAVVREWHGARGRPGGAVLSGWRPTNGLLEQILRRSS
jgi:hypothetical protein